MSEEIFSLIFIFIVLGTPFCGAQDCNIVGSKLLCEKIVRQFPNVFYGNYELQCKDCQLKTFDQETFPYENNLSSFNLSYGGLHQVDKNSFSHFKNLHYLLLQNNHIRNLTPGAFHGLDELFELHLQDNALVNLQPGFMQGASSNLVNLSGNLLETLPEKVFYGSKLILYIDLSSNNLRSLNRNTFEGLKDLENLDLSGNVLCHLPLGLFKSMASLRRLNLNHNKFTQFQYGVFTGLEFLNYLSLAHNSLNDFDAAALLPMMHLTRLDISGNAIYTFDANEILLNVPTLNVISFEDNLFSCVLLKNVLQFFKQKNIEMEINELRFEHLNINGIACIEDYTIGQSISLDYFLRKSKEQADQLVSYC